MSLQNSIIILAAGGSERMGRPKQLLEFKGKSMVAGIADAALDAKQFNVIVITGAVKDEVTAALTGKDVHLVYNPDWETGMASGIAAGVKYISEQLPETENIIIAACDQPYVSAELFNELLAEKNRSGKNMVASGYAGTKGIPALFSKKYFSYLLPLSGNGGAKQLFAEHPEDTAVVAFEKGGVDVDTEEDYRQLASKK